MLITPKEETTRDAPIEAVIFDLDGTLIDSLPDIAAAADQALSSFALPGHSPDEYRTMIGWGIGELARLALPADGSCTITQKQLVDEIEAVYLEHAFEHGLVYPGTGELLRELSVRGIQRAVLTNKVHEVAVRAVELAFPDIEFQFVRGDIAGKPKKPDPAVVEEVIDALGAERQRVVMVGDSDVDITTGRAAGLRTIGAAWGYRGAAHLREAGAELIFDSAAELQSFLFP